MTDLEQEELPATKSGFVATHCRNCGGGLTIARAAGGKKATFCLLMREWVTDKHSRELISDCDRFEEREQAEAAD